MGRGFDGAAQGYARAYPYVRRGDHALVLEHDSAELALGVEADAELRDVIAVRVVVAREVFFQYLSLPAASDIGIAYIVRFKPLHDSEL